MAAARRRSEPTDGDASAGGREPIESSLETREVAGREATTGHEGEPDEAPERPDGATMTDAPTGAGHIEFTWDGDWQTPRESLPTLHDIDPLRHDTAPPSSPRADGEPPAPRDSLPTLEDDDPLRHDQVDRSSRGPDADSSE